MNNVEQKLKESIMIETILSSAKYLYELERKNYSQQFGCLLDIINLDNTPIETINYHRHCFIITAYNIVMSSALDEYEKSSRILDYAQIFLDEKILATLEENQNQFVGTTKEFLVKRLVAQLN